MFNACIKCGNLAELCKCHSRDKFSCYALLQEIKFINNYYGSISNSPYQDRSRNLPKLFELCDNCKFRFKCWTE